MQDWQYVKLGEVCAKDSSNIAQKDLENSNGEYPIYGASGFIKNIDFYQQEKEYIAVVKDGAGVGRAMLLPAKSSVIGTMQYIIPNEEISTKYLYYAIENMNLAKYYSGATIPHIYFRDYQKETFRLPKRKEQEKISAVFEKIEQMVDYRKQQLQKLDDLVKARFVEMTEASTVVLTKMGDIATYINGYAFKPVQWEETGYPIIRIQNLNDSNAPYNYYSGVLQDKYLVQNGDVLISWATHLEAYIWNGDKAWLNQHIFKVVFDKLEVDKIYFVYACEEALRQAFRNAHGFKPTMEHIKKSDFDAAIVKLPDLNIQKQFADLVQQIDKSKLEVQKSLDKLETLKKALMQKYFG